MKKVFFILLALVVISTLVVTGCSSPPSPSTTAPVTTSKPAATTTAPATSAPAATTAAPTTSAPATTTPSAGVISLKFAFDMPATGAIVPGWTQYFGPELQTRSNGRVKVDFYPAAALFNQTDTPDSLKAGVADIANIALSAHAQQFPISNIFVLPGMEFPDATRDDYLAKYNAILQLSQKYASLSSELTDFKVLMWVPNPSYRIMSKKLIIVPDDVKGVKLAGASMSGQITKLAGGVWVSGVPNDFYDGLSKGTFDGFYASWAQNNTYKFEEVASYFLDYGFTQEIQIIAMNLKKWNSLPPDIQKIIMDLAPASIGASGDSQIALSQKGIANAKVKNRTITTPNADQGAMWDKLVAPIQDTWVKDAQSKGAKDAGTILSDLKALRAAAMAVPASPAK
jgi:TRAP-type C4-dicarboxylate transport system substrate-binding protein